MFFAVKSHADKALRLVEGKEMVNFISQPFRHNTDIFFKPNGTFRVEPAAPFIEGIGVIPVKQGGIRSDAGLQKLFCKFLIKLHTLFIDSACSLRQDPGPADGETIGLYAQLLHQSHILPETMVMIAGHISRMALKNRTGPPTEHIPYGEALSIFISRPFNLIRSGGRPPDKILWKSHMHNSSLLGSSGFRRSANPSGSSVSH